MKNYKLKSCVKLLANAEVMIVNERHFLFNSCKRLYEFQKKLEGAVGSAFDEHLLNHSKIKGDVAPYLFCLQNQFNKLHKNFYDVDDFVVHRKLKIEDFDGSKIEFNMLSPEIKESISNHIMVQKSALHCLSDKFNYHNQQIVNSHIKWLVSRNDLLELSIALYYGNIVGFEDKKITKTEFFDHMSKITGINIENSNVTQNKLLNRKTPNQFLLRLNAVINNLIDKSSQ